MKNTKVRVLTESAIMIALSTVLSILKIAEMPYGGSVTVASALPIIIIAYRYGLKTGLFAGTVHAALQLVLGLSALSYATSWQSVVAIIMLDYIVAFAVTIRFFITSNAFITISVMSESINISINFKFIVVHF